jgi:hypothetical protein
VKGRVDFFFGLRILMFEVFLVKIEGFLEEMLVLELEALVEAASEYMANCITLSSLELEIPWTFPVIGFFTLEG